MNKNNYVKKLAEEALKTFRVISDKASMEVQDYPNESGARALVSVNTFNDDSATKLMESNDKSSIESAKHLINEPAIARLVVLDENNKTNVYYISRKSSLTLAGEIKLASYKSAMGSLASQPVGEVVTINDKELTIIERSIFKSIRVSDIWDSKPTEIQSSKYGPFTVISLRKELREDIDNLDAEAEYAKYRASLEESDENNIKIGLQHEVRMAMNIRDQPILDKFQDEIFRLDLDKQILIIGPPGTGKTTTLIRRLGQKIDKDFLTPREKGVIGKADNNHTTHENSWLMFSPTELLKHYVKEAFNREDVPASNERIKTWISFRDKFSREVLGILMSPNSKGKFILKENSIPSKAIIDNPIDWFEEFELFHKNRILSQLVNGVEIIKSLVNETNRTLVEKVLSTMENENNLISIYRELNDLEVELEPFLKKMKDDSDKKIRHCETEEFRSDKLIFKSLAEFIDTLDIDETDADVDDEFNDETLDEAPSNQTTKKQASVIYQQVIRSLARYKYLKRSLPKKSRSYVIVQWLNKRIPDNKILLEIGESITIQNGFRRFLKPSRRYISDVSASYKEFRKESVKNKQCWYTEEKSNPKHINGVELDLVVLLMLKNVRQLLSQKFVSDKVAQSKFPLVKLISEKFKNQILVDEATDFSPIQLACMESLTNINTKSFFACGDFNQRITSWGTRDESQMKWAIKNLNIKTINVVYRQSRKLNLFSNTLLKVLGGDISSKAELPKHMNHDGVNPVFIKNCNEIFEITEWLSNRIVEVNRMAGKMPTIAVLVNREQDVIPMAKALNEKLEDNNIKAIPCSDGKSLGDGDDVRVFCIEHIKGLEFEAVFFVGLDELAELNPDLYLKYLYVGATRAATYFGITCNSSLPGSLKPLTNQFSDNWK